MVTRHHGLSLWQLMARVWRVVVVGREIAGRARSRVVPLLHHVHILLLMLRLMLLLLLLLRVRLRVMVVGVLRRVGHVHRGRDRDSLRDDRRRSFVDCWHLAHLDARGRVEFVTRRRGV